MDKKTIIIISVTSLTVVVLTLAAVFIYLTISRANVQPKVDTPYMQEEPVETAEKQQGMEAPSPVQDISDVDAEVDYLDSVIEEASGEGFTDSELPQ